MRKNRSGEGPAQKVRRMRGAAGLSQAQLAEKAGVSLVTIKRMERGHVVSLPTLQRVASALGVTAGALLDPLHRPRRRAP